MKLKSIISLESIVTVIHPKYVEVKEKILRHIFMGRDGYVLFVVGPSRVGKSRLCNHIISELTGKISNDTIKGYSKPIFITASADQSKTALWSSIYRKILYQLGDDSWNEKVSPDFTLARKKASLKVRGRPRLSFEDMKYLLAERVNYYKPICIFIDEISWVGVGGGPISDLFSATLLHEMASMLNTKIILFGTCGAIEFLNLNEQLSLRTERVFFDRYHNNHKDINIFFRAATEILDACGLKYNEEIIQNKKTIYEVSLGCVGEFSAWAQKSITAMESSFADCLTMGHMKSQMAEYDRLSTAELKIREFERYCEYSKQEFSLKKFESEFCFEEKRNIEYSRKIKLKPGKRHPINDRTGDLFSSIV